MSETRQILRWSAPDATRRRIASIVDEYADCAAELTAHPGEWAVLFCGPEAEAAKIGGAMRAGKGPFKATSERRFAVSVRLKPKDDARRGDPYREYEVFVRCVAGYGATS